MKVAICYSGIINDNFEKCYQHHMSSLQLYNHDVDYFVYLWEDKYNRYRKFFEEIMKPKMFLMGSVIDENYYKNNETKSKYYSIMKADLLRKNYERINNIKYDCVIRLEFITGFEHQININTYDLSKLNILNDKYFRGYDLNIYSLFALSNRNIMEIYADCYNYMDIYSQKDVPIDKMGEYHIKNNNIKINKIKLDSYIYHDMEYINNNLKDDFRDKKEVKTCMVVAFYYGERTNNETIHNLMETQKRFLRRYQHNLSRIVFAIAEDNRTNIEIKEDNGITMFYKPNNGLSFGSWNSVVNYYKEEYDYYIFSEDDYLFCKDHFDRILINEYRKQRSPYLVTYKLLRCNLLSTIGIISTEELKKINYMNDIVWTHDKVKSMRDFLNVFSSYNCISKPYSSFPYWGNINNIWDVWLFDYIPGESTEDYNNRILLTPIQYVDEKDNLKEPQIYKFLYQDFHVDQVDDS